MRNLNGRWRTRAAAAAGCLTLAGAGSAGAFQALPPGTQVNDDPAAGITGSLGVTGEDPANADVVGGALTAGNPAVPWAVFQQTESTPTTTDQIFSRSFAGGAWTTRGSGTVGGRSSASPAYPGSLNFDQGQDGEVPAIDFAGAGRTVPWATWYETTTGTGFGTDNIFASRFDNSGDANQGKWIFEGQGRGTGGVGTTPVPSLNIHTNRNAENPAIAGGTPVAGGNPVPWVAWQEDDGTSSVLNPSQIFVSRAAKPSVPPACDTGTKPASTTGAVATFCWQQVGIERQASGSTSVPPSTTDPSLNVDTTRSGVEPDIAFTGPSDQVPWVVWYEQGTGTAGLHTNAMVFAAKGITPVTPTGTVDGGLNWQVVGSSAQGLLDDSAGGGTCAASQSAEAACSLNSDASDDAVDPRIAAGTMTAGSNTVPWITWSETVGAVDQIFVARLVGTTFVIANGGAPISSVTAESTRPDITFSGHTPYVTWRQSTGAGTDTLMTGHFVNAANPTFVLDPSDVAITPHTIADVREPISSACTANPFNADGASCQGGALGTPFFLFTSGSSPAGLFGDAYQPDTPVTGAANAITETSATVAGTVDPHGTATSVSFQFGTSTAYGQTTTPTSLGPDEAADPVTASLTGLAAGTLIHYRVVASTDLGTVTGPDQTFTTAGGQATTPGQTTTPGSTPAAGTATAAHGSVQGQTIVAAVSCTGATGATGAAPCALTATLTTVEKLKHHRVIGTAAMAKRKPKVTRRTVTIGTASLSLAAGQKAAVKVTLNRAGKRLLAKLHRLAGRLVITQTVNGKPVTILAQNVTFKAKPKQKRKPKHH